MCKVQMLRALVKQRLTAAAEEIFGLFERTIAEYEEELCRSREENERHRKLLDAVFKPQLRIHRADVQQLLVVKEEVPPEQQDPEPPPHIKEEQEELWSSQEGEQFQGLEEADITKLTFTPVPVKSEDDEEKPQSSQLHQRQTEHMETEADGEDCGGPEAARNSDPERHLHPDTEDKTGESSEPETEESDDWKESREPRSGSNSVSNSRSSAGEKPFTCSQCGKRFGRKCNLKRHIGTHTEEKPFSCSVCNKRFVRRYLVKIHKCDVPQSSQLHQSQTEGQLHPDTEDRTGDSSEPDDTDGWKESREPPSGSNSVSDSRSSAAEKPFSCSECGKRFGLKGDLNRHIRIHTGEKPFSCSVCDKRFLLKKHLNRHIATHTGEKPFSCSVCKKSFAQRGNLQTHVRIHTGEKPFSCSVCGKGFSLKDLRTHTEEKPFSCNVCKKYFTLRSTLHTHMRIHTGEKPFSCSVCDKTFLLKDHLKTHMKTHTGEKPFSCSVCSKGFSRKETLVRHLRTHTGETVQTTVIV